jgi:hypothetical protein
LTVEIVDNVHRSRDVTDGDMPMVDCHYACGLGHDPIATVVITATRSVRLSETRFCLFRAPLYLPDRAVLSRDCRSTCAQGRRSAQPDTEGGAPKPWRHSSKVHRRFPQGPTGPLIKQQHRENIHTCLGWQNRLTVKLSNEREPLTDLIAKTFFGRPVFMRKGPSRE